MRVGTAHGSPPGFYSAEPAGGFDFLLAAEIAALPRAEPAVVVAASRSAGAPAGGGGFGERALRDGLAGFVGSTTVVDLRAERARGRERAPTARKSTSRR